MCAATTPKPTTPPLLYLITNDKDLPTEDHLLTAVTQAVQAGVQWIQFRTKPHTAHNTQSPPNHTGPFPTFTQRLHIAKQLQTICTQHNALLFINDEVELAAACGAHLHLGQGDASLALARAQLSKDRLIGVTCHDQIGLAQTAHKQGADYVSFGAFFPSSTKPHARPAKPDILKHPEQPPLPKVAIGGITLHNAPELLQAGANVLAVSHAILGAADIGQASREFLAQLQAFSASA